MKKKQKQIEQFDKMLKKFITKKDYVQIYRMVQEGAANISGFLLEVSDDFLLVQNEEEFRLEGYSIIRKDHFDAIRCSKSEKKIKQILKAEGIIDKKYGISKAVPLASWASIFQHLKEEDHHVIVECEDLEKPTFNIGAIIDISKKAVQIKHFTAEGIIKKKPKKIAFKNITLVRFDDRYINLYRKYLVPA